LLRLLLLSLPLALLTAGCGGDYTAASADVTFVPLEEEQPVGLDELLDPEAPVVGGVADPASDPAPVDDPVADPVDDPIAPADDPLVDDPVEDPPPETDDPPEDDVYDPDWTDNDDPIVEGCLETLPAICNKVSECGEDQPVLELLGGFCPTLFDSISPVLELGCEQVGGLLQGALPDVDIPLGGALDEMIFTLITGCIENFQCDPEYLAELGAQFGEVIAAFGGGGGDIGAALPALLGLAEMCGGLQNFLPF
jgi:hypothetical protein